MNTVKTKETDHSTQTTEKYKNIIFQLFYDQLKEENYESIIDFDDYSF